MQILKLIFVFTFLTSLPVLKSQVTIHDEPDLLDLICVYPGYDVADVQYWIDDFIANANVSTNCQTGSNLTWSHNHVYPQTPDFCESLGIVIFTVTDECGNSDNVMGEIIVSDFQAPVLNPPAITNHYLNCDGNGNIIGLQALHNQDYTFTGLWDSCAGSLPLLFNGASPLNTTMTCNNSYTFTAYLDDGCISQSLWQTFTIHIVDPCPAPTAGQLTTTQISDNSARLRCTNIQGVNKYDWRFRLAGANNWTPLPEGGLVRILTNLLPSRMYEWQSRVRCGTSWSAWSATEIFETSIACVPPTSSQLTTTHIFSNRGRMTSVNLLGVNRYDWRYRVDGTNVWIDVPDSGRVQNITGLASNTKYFWRCRVRCGSFWTSYSPVKTFTTL